MNFDLHLCRISVSIFNILPKFHSYMHEQFGQALTFGQSITIPLESKYRRFERAGNRTRFLFPFLAQILIFLPLIQQQRSFAPHFAVANDPTGKF